MGNVRRIVVFAGQFRNTERQVALLKAHGAKIIRVLKIVNGVAIEMTPDTEKMLSKAPEVLRIESDEPVFKSL